MRTCYFIKTDSKLNDSYENMSRIPHQKKFNENFLNIKRKREEENFRINMEYEFYESKAEEVLKAFISIFPMFQENNILEEDEKSCEDNERYFIKKIKEEKSLFNVFNPDHYLFTKATED